MRMSRMLGAAAMTAALVLSAAGAVGGTSLVRRGVRRQQLQGLYGDLTKPNWRIPTAFFYMDVKDASESPELVVRQTYALITLRRAGPCRELFLDNIGKKSGERVCREDGRENYPRRIAQVASDGILRRWATAGLVGATHAFAPPGRLRSALPRGNNETSRSRHRRVHRSADACVRPVHLRRSPEHGVHGQAAATGAPAPRLANGRPDLSGHWLPNGAAMASAAASASIRAARGQFESQVTPENGLSFQPWALEKIKSMTPNGGRAVEVVGQLHARGVPPSGWQNPYSTVLVHTPTMFCAVCTKSSITGASYTWT